MTILPEHLGGHADKTNLDEGALKWVIDKFKPDTFLDIGCGPGGMVELAEKHGISSFGVDGDFTLERYNPDRFLIHDFTHGPAPLHNTYDIGWSVEFVEHVYEEYIPSYIEAFKHCKVVIMTYAPPGHGGYHHVNEQTAEYWIQQFSKYGFTHQPELSLELRNSSTMGSKKKKQFVRARGMVFYNEN